jgi:hypothetical protein
MVSALPESTVMVRPSIVIEPLAPPAGVPITLKKYGRIPGIRTTRVVNGKMPGRIDGSA